MNLSAAGIEKIPSIPVAVAGMMLGLGAQTVEYGLRQGRFPWGYAVQTGPERFRYWINRDKFCEIERVPVEKVMEYERALSA